MFYNLADFRSHKMSSIEHTSTVEPFRFKLRDIFVLTLVVAILVCIVAPVVNSLRESSRRMGCTNNLRQLALALHNYESTFRRMPCAMGGTDGPPQLSNAGAISGFVPMVPYLEHTAWYSKLDSTPPRGGPAPWIPIKLWDDQFLVLVCLSDPNTRSKSMGWARTNYAFCWGDGVQGLLDEPPRPSTRGPFQAKLRRRLSDITDGLAKTIGFGEIRVFPGNRGSGVFIVAGIEQDPSLCLAVGQTANPVTPSVSVTPHGRGGRWIDGRPFYTGFTTVLAPNSPTCVPVDDDGTWGVFSSSSYHTGVVQVVMLDGSTRAIANTIDCGLSSSTPLDEAQRSKQLLRSPYGVWGAMGTMNTFDAADGALVD